MKKLNEMKKKTKRLFTTFSAMMASLFATTNMVFAQGLTEEKSASTIETVGSVANIVAVIATVVIIVLFIIVWVLMKRRKQ